MNDEIKNENAFSEVINQMSEEEIKVLAGFATAHARAVMGLAPDKTQDDRLHPEEETHIDVPKV